MANFIHQPDSLVPALTTGDEEAETAQKVPQKHKYRINYTALEAGTVSV